MCQQWIDNRRSKQLSSSNSLSVRNLYLCFVPSLLQNCITTRNPGTHPSDSQTDQQSPGKLNKEQSH